MGSSLATSDDRPRPCLQLPHGVEQERYSYRMIREVDSYISPLQPFLSQRECAEIRPHDLYLYRVG